MANWEEYPENYRADEVQAVLKAVQAGECAAVIGLSGAGKSNFMGFLAQRIHLPAPGPRFVLVDCNRLNGELPAALFRLARHSLGDTIPAENELVALEQAIAAALSTGNGLCLLFDRFDVVSASAAGSLYGNLRALRDAYKYELTYVIASRHPLEDSNELAELFFGNTIWLGPLQASDGRWSAERFARRKGLAWEAATLSALNQLSWSYPSFLRAACEALAAGVPLELQAMRAAQPVQRRLTEFLKDAPTRDELIHARLEGHPWLGSSGASVPDQAAALDTTCLTAKEHALLKYLMARPNQICEKDDLIRAIWPEDRIFEQGIRDDSLAQLVRRLRRKIEPDEADPRYILTAPGRGYLFRKKT